MMAYERSESAWNNFGIFIYRLQPKTKTLVRKLESILKNILTKCVFIFSQTCLNKGLLPNHTHTHHTCVYDMATA